MAVSIAFPPLPKFHSEPLSLHDSWCSLPAGCGFDSSVLAAIKLEPVTSEESMEEDDSPFCSSATYTELSPATLADIKLGTKELYKTKDENEDPSFASWTYRHPHHWGTREVLDWLFTLSEQEGFDPQLFRPEAYNALTGPQLTRMTSQEFAKLDANYGTRVHESLSWLMQDSDFKAPSPPENFKTESLGNVPFFLTVTSQASSSFSSSPSSSTSSSSSSSSSSSQASTPNNDRVSVYVCRNGGEMVVSVDGLGLYDIDISATAKGSFDNISDSDYNSDHENERSHSVSSDVFDDSRDDDDSLLYPALDPLRGSQPPSSSSSSSSPSSSSSSDSGCEGDEQRQATGRRERRQNTASKGNHLWEFVRDLLKDPRFNPSLLKWEDRSIGVFKFVQSEAVAKMWGRKKNNPGMTYEKLSRAMRFCRSAGYFDTVPKTGRFPKKLCFRFGHKAQGWRD